MTAVKYAAPTLLGRPCRVSVFTLSGSVPRRGVAGSPGGPFTMLPTVAAPGCDLTSSARGLPRTRITAQPVPGGSRRAGGRWPLPVGLVCASPMVSDAEPLGHLCLVWENIYSYPLPTLKSFLRFFKRFFFFAVELYDSFIYMCVCIYMCVYIYMCVCIRVCVCVCVYI